jgi:DNA-binding winged helix-turn-helix (wHTH) protein
VRELVHPVVLCHDCRFGRFELQPGERRLLADGRPVALGARAFDLLVALVARAGQLVSKNELLTLVWPGLVVEENNLQVQVSTLRKRLGPSAVATIPGRGYRFELELERVAGAPTASKADAPVAAPTGAPAAPPRAPTNLPPRIATLFGRAADVAAVRALLAQHAVVTIAGAGGIGKTRVAQAAAAQLAEERIAEFPDGVWWVELAPLADGALERAGVGREMHWTRVRDHLDPMFRAGLAPEELARLRAEGAAMREEDAVRLALGTGQH